eukprot:3601360-Pyramimonas_sp.AAC.1
MAGGCPACPPAARECRCTCGRRRGRRTCGGRRGASGCAGRRPFCRSLWLRQQGHLGPWS